MAWRAAHQVTCLFPLSALLSLNRPSCWSVPCVPLVSAVCPSNLESPVPLSRVSGSLCFHLKTPDTAGCLSTSWGPCMDSPGSRAGLRKSHPCSPCQLASRCGWWSSIFHSYGTALNLTAPVFKEKGCFTAGITQPLRGEGWRAVARPLPCRQGPARPWKPRSGEQLARSPWEAPRRNAQGCRPGPLSSWLLSLSLSHSSHRHITKPYLQTLKSELHLILHHKIFS